MTPKVIWRNRWLVSAITTFGMAALVLTVSFTAGSREPTLPHVPAVIVGEAEDMDQLVSKADVIVVGTIGVSATERTINPYSGGSDLAPRMPVTDYQVTVTSVLKGDGDISSGDTLTLREFGHLSKEETNPEFYENFPMSRVGDSRLFVLGKNPDDTTYGLYFGRFSQFSIDGNVVEYSDMGGKEVRFARNVSPTDFLTAIREEMNR